MEYAWAIQFPTNRGFSLYTGTAPTRRDAIAQHVWAYDRVLYDAGWPHVSTNGNAPLSDRQKAEWEKCRARGDRAVRVKIETVET